MIVRKAVREDMKAVLELIQELANFENEPNAVKITVAQLENDGFGTHPLFHCFVAEEANEIIGIALFYYRYSTWKGKTIHLEDLIVRESKRGIGAGFALYKEIIQQGKSKSDVVDAEIGLKKSSAQITKRYSKEDLIGKQIIAVVNFPPKQIGNFMSECLVLGSVNVDEVVLLTSDLKVQNGLRIA